MTPKCPYCGSTETRECPEYLYWLRIPAWSCDNCEGRVFTKDDMEVEK